VRWFDRLVWQMRAKFLDATSLRGYVNPDLLGVVVITSSSFSLLSSQELSDTQSL
jgi:hypothetical protein